MSKSLDDHFEFITEQKKLISRIQACIDNSSELNSWEDDFLDSILKGVISGKSLTGPMYDKLEEIEGVIAYGRDW